MLGQAEEDPEVQTEQMCRKIYEGSAGESTSNDVNVCSNTYFSRWDEAARQKRLDSIKEKIKDKKTLDLVLSYFQKYSELFGAFERLDGVQEVPRSNYRGTSGASEDYTREKLTNDNYAQLLELIVNEKIPSVSESEAQKIDIQLNATYQSYFFSKNPKNKDRKNWPAYAADVKRLNKTLRNSQRFWLKYREQVIALAEAQSPNKKDKNARIRALKAVVSEMRLTEFFVVSQNYTPVLKWQQKS